MGLCFLGMGDCGAKSDTKSITNIKNINQSMTNMVTSTSNSVTATQFNVQSNSIKVIAPPGYDFKTYGPLVDGCVFTNNQSMNASQKVSVTLDLKDTKSLQKQISSALKQTNDNAVKQKTEAFATASTTANNYTEVNQVIENLVSTNITNDVRNSLTVLMKNAQSNKLEIPGPVKCTSANPTLSSNVQSMITSQIVDTITKSLTGTTLSEALKTETDLANKNKVDQESGGLAGLIKSVGDMIGSIVGGALLVPALMIGGCCVLIILLIWGIPKLLGPNATPTPAQFGKLFFGKSRFGSKR